MNPAIAGAQLNAALYLVCVFVAGNLTHHTFSWQCAIAAMGVTCVGYQLDFLAQIDTRFRYASLIAVAASIGLGIIAGLSLLF